MSFIAVCFHDKNPSTGKRKFQYTINFSCQVVDFTGTVSQHKLSSLQNHGALHKGARMHMNPGSGVAFTMTDNHYSLL
jgi:hypothetical protein